MVLELRNVDIGYSKPILKGINLKILPSQCIIVHGPNGIGKTTLLKTIATFLKPIRGQILLYDKSINHYKKEIFFLPEVIDIPDQISALNYVRAVGSLYGNSNKSSAEKALELVNIEPRTPIKQLSHGMKRRVQLASALMVKAKLYLLDDPMIAIDEHDKNSLLKDIIAQLINHNPIIIIATRETLNLDVPHIDLTRYK